MDCARQLCCYVCFFFVSVHIAHLRQGINLSSENEKSASQGVFFFLHCFILQMIFSVLFICKERESEWMLVCAWLWIEHFLVLFSEKFMLCGLIEIQNSMLTTLLVRNITSLYLIAWDLNHQFYQVKTDRLVWTSEIQADEEFDWVNKREFHAENDNHVNGCMYLVYRKTQFAWIIFQFGKWKT